MKPTKEEILSDKLKKQAERVAFEDGSGIMFIRYSFDARELQEYAEQFHKEKLREELIKFAGFITDEYLKTKE